MKKYTTPGYPTREVLDSDPDILRQVPSAWQRNGRVLTALALGLGVGTTLYTLAAEMEPSHTMGVMVQRYPDPDLVAGLTISDIAPVPVIDHMLLVPLRSVAPPLGATVRYDAVKRQSIISRKGMEIAFTSRSRAVLVNGKPAVLAVATLEKHRELYVPLRFLVDHFGGKIEWNDHTGQATVTSAKAHITVVFNTHIQTSILRIPRRRHHRHHRRAEAQPAPTQGIPVFPRISRAQVKEFLGWLKAEGIV